MREGRQQLGLWSGLRSTVTTEIFAGCGFDFLVVDMEHAPNDTADVMLQLQVIAAYPDVSALVRPPWNDPVAIKRVLDAGAQTNLVPYVQSADEAARAVAATRYPTAGIRGVAGIGRQRATAPSTTTCAADDEMCVFVQLETVDALRELERIAAVPGVDGIFIGPADLSASMGYLGQLAGRAGARGDPRRLRARAQRGDPVRFPHQSRARAAVCRHGRPHARAFDRHRPGRGRRRGAGPPVRALAGWGPRLDCGDGAGRLRGQVALPGDNGSVAAGGMESEREREPRERPVLGERIGDDGRPAVLRQRSQ